ncbi:ABC transporter ATP-binding protein [Mycoplana dimorpha]|uniref:Iron(III) transport system ATP-binding protein n=1 Tax=Mycoplana dimorpha TaxID=28320 RepID=A0A2T5BAZ0_MYCDI|nr:ABC transporter ATP-binding protein [Mycoplana dimorpha]PTM96136.1 iron(III) transport system ATP-binding protein [Mycoplana dimorpha]
MIQISRLYKTYPGSKYTPVDDLSLEIQDGHFFTLLGPSGCGKSTTLRCIAGLERPDQGEIKINGVSVFSAEAGRNLPPYKRALSMVFQSYAIWPHMTVFQNVAYPLKCQGQSREDIRKEVAWSLDLVGLGHLADRPAPLLSGGEQQRVALARAIAGRSKVILFDEPLSNLDAKLRETMRSEIRALHQQLKFTALYVTHDQEEAFSMSDMVAIMNKGKVRELGSPEELYTTPRSEFGAEFLGARTKVSGTVRGRTDDNLLVVETPLGVVHCRHFADHPPGTSVFVYVRQSEILPSEGAAQPGAPVFSARIDSVEFVGDTIDWVARAGDIALHGRSLLGRPDCKKIREHLNEAIDLQIVSACCVPST